MASSEDFKRILELYNQESKTSGISKSITGMYFQHKNLDYQSLKDLVWKLEVWKLLGYNPRQKCHCLIWRDKNSLIQ